MTNTDATAVATGHLERLERAWNSSNGPAFGDEFADDSAFVDIRGGYHRGADAIAAGHQDLFDSVYAATSICYHLEAAREVAPGCVVAVAGATLQASSGPMQGTHRSRLTAVITERAGHSAITAFHNTLVNEGR